MNLKKLIPIFALILLVAIVSSLDINFVNPTPSNAGVTQNSYVEINVTIEDTELKTVIFNWNGTNYTVYNDSLVLMMNFENISLLGENDTIVKDLSIHSNNGTLTSGAKYNSSGIYGSAIQFDGSNDKIRINNSDIPGHSLDFTGNFTLETWFNYDTGDGTLIAKRDGSLDQYQLFIQNIGGNQRLSFRAGGEFGYASDTILVAGTWYHAVVTIDETNSPELYIDGAKETWTDNTGSRPFSFTHRNVNVSIGVRWNVEPTSAFRFDGKIDEVRIWNRTLSADEINLSYQYNLRKFNRTTWKLYVNKTGLSEGNYTFQTSMTNTTASTNTAQRTVTRDITAPTEVLTLLQPNSTANFDPYGNVTINITLSDDIPLDSVILQYFNSSGWANKTMLYDGVSYIANLTLGTQNENYTFNVKANDSAGNIFLLTGQNITSAWDCTWSATPTDLGATAAFDTITNIGYINISNTGDAAYNAGNCSLDFRLTYDLAEGRIYFNGSFLKPSNTFTGTAQSNQTIKVNGSFLAEVNEAPVIITISDALSRSETKERNVSTTLVSTTGGPYLFQTITSSPSSVDLTFNNFSLEGYVRNLLGDGTKTNTAYNVTVNWSLPSDFLISGGISDVTYFNLSNTSITPNNINITFNETNLPDLSPGSVSITLHALGFNQTAVEINHSGGIILLTKQVNITLICVLASDGIFVTACGSLDGDEPEADPVVTPSNTPGQGGGGGGGGASTRTIVSSGLFEITRGIDDFFILPIENKFDSIMQNIEITATGELAEFIEISSIPKEVGPGETENATILIVIPSYFTTGSSILTFTISGDLLITTETGTTQTSPFTDKKTFTLLISELSRSDALSLLELSREQIQAVQDLNLTTIKLQSILATAEAKLEQRSYEEVKLLYEQILNTAEKATTAFNKIQDLKVLILDAKRRGIKTPGTERLISLAETALQREDYEIAAERIEDAEFTYNLETKGEFSILYTIRNNPLQSLFIVFSFILLTLFTTRVYRLTRVNFELRRISKEQNILQQLIKTAQREAFEKKTISMGQYTTTVKQYEERANTGLQREVELESTKAFLLNPFVNKYDLEKKRLLNLIREIQDEYIIQKKQDTRSYRTKIESYYKRLSEVEGKAVIKEAKAAVRKAKLSLLLAKLKIKSWFIKKDIKKEVKASIKKKPLKKVAQKPSLLSRFLSYFKSPIRTVKPLPVPIVKRVKVKPVIVHIPSHKPTLLSKIMQTLLLKPMDKKGIVLLDHSFLDRIKEQVKEKNCYGKWINLKEKKEEENEDKE